MNDIQFSGEIRAAIKSGDVDRVASLLEASGDRINMVTPFGTWLHVAATAGNLDVFKRLVEMGADINKRGGTFEAGPLKTAASYGHIEIVRYLLSRGVEIDVGEPFRNPLYGAIYSGHLDIVRLLVEHGIDPRLKYFGAVMQGSDSIDYAREQGRSEIAEYLSSTTKFGKAVGA